VADEYRVQPAGSQPPAQIFLTASVVHCPEFNREAIEQFWVLHRTPRGCDSLCGPGSGDRLRLDGIEGTWRHFHEHENPPLLPKQNRRFRDGFFTETGGVKSSTAR
jgi:hypothetical protein